MNRRAISRKVVGAFVLLFVVGLWVYVDKIRPQQLYYAKNGEIARRLAGLGKQAPSQINPHVWNELTKLTCIGFGNVFFTPHHASYAEMLRFQNDLEEKLRTDKPIQVETLRWVWKRLGQTGPHGKEYSERMILLFEADAAQASESN